MKRVLAFDTATESVAIGAGLWPDDEEDAPAQVLGSLDFDAPRAANEKLLLATNALLRSLGWEPDDPEVVVVGTGPGSFTGVRIAVATAKGFALGLGKPLIGIGTLDAIARRFASYEGLLAVVGDAMRGEVYPALFRCGAGAVLRLTENAVGKPDAVACSWAEQVDGALLLAGNGLKKYADVFVDALGDRAELAPRDTWSPSGAGLLAEGFAARRRALGDPGSVLPVYTRLSDAEEAESLRSGLPPVSGVAGDGAEVR